MNDLASRITPLQRALITIAVMTVTLMQVLDITIVNVALPYMQGSLGASPDEISWTLTSYLVSAAIFMPLTGYFSDKFGLKNYLLISMLGFTITSALCGFSHNLTEIVAFRMLQGAFGASLIPLAQALLTEIYPKTQRAKAMAIWGFGVMVGPILGPTLGGYLTEVGNWRYTFFVNVPFGFLALFLAWQVVPHFEKRVRSMDWLGLLFISLAIGSLQYFLDRGNQQDWFSAWDIRMALLLLIGGLLAFLVHNAFKPTHTVFNLNIFKDRNFTLASILIAMMGVGMFGVMVIQPLMLENLFNYPVLTTGLVMAPRGIAGMIGMIFMGKYGPKIDPRYTILIGVILNVIGVHSYTHLSLSADMITIIWPMFLQGFGVSMIFTSLSMIAFSTLGQQLFVEASGLFSLLRTVGSSIGISLTIVVYTHEGQVLWNQLGGFINSYNSAVSAYLSHINLPLGAPVAHQILGQTLRAQSQILAIVNTFDFIMWSYILMLPFILLIKKPLQKTEIPAATH